jgi:agmatine deiminase
MKARSRQSAKTVSSQNSQHRMPAEWEPHESTWLAWPHYRDDWPGKFEAIPWVFAEIIRHLTRHERVNLVVNDAASEKRAHKVLDRANALNDNLTFHRWPTNRVWTRDSGCSFVKSDSGRLSSVKWHFNAWTKYSNWKHDDKLGSLMGKQANAVELRPQFHAKSVVLEGGSIDVNGTGTLITTEECLLSKIQQRNPSMKRSDYEEVFATYLGIRNVIWLGNGIAGDDTHGHVDDLTRFVAADTVVTAVGADTGDENYEPLQENIRRLRAATDQDGHSLAIVELPMPGPIIFEGRRLPASYANFYIANGLVLVPVFNDPNDRIALDVIADLFPERETVGIYCGDLIWGFGAIHCMTQQQPA